MKIALWLEAPDVGAHLNGDEGVVILAPPGSLSPDELQAAKPELRRFLAENPDAPCAERAREYLVQAALDRIVTAYLRAGKPYTHPSPKEDTVRDGLERVWVAARVDATDAARFPEALSRWEREILRAISTAADQTEQRLTRTSLGDCDEKDV